jgi:hypothetical protein
MSGGSSSVAPAPGDYVVLHEPQSAYGTPRLALIRLSPGAGHHLIRATFESAERAGHRFEQQARVMAAAAKTRAFRCVDGLYIALDALMDNHDA